MTAGQKENRCPKQIQFANKRSQRRSQGSKRGGQWVSLLPLSWPSRLGNLASRDAHKLREGRVDCQAIAEHGSDFLEYRRRQDSGQVFGRFGDLQIEIPVDVDFP